MSQTTPFIEYANIGDVKVTAKYDLESYFQGAKEFAEWLGIKEEHVDTVLAEWQKGKENE